MEILPIETVQELEDLTLSEELVNLCQTKPHDTAKIIKHVSAKIRNRIDKEIFYDEGTDSYIIPEDLKVACASLCESVYTYSVKEWQNNATSRKVSERIDDYSITYSDSQSAYTFFWIPTDSDVIALIEAYSWISGKWYWNIHLH